MQLCRAACYWFPWWVSKINIKVCDRRMVCWFKRSRGCSHNVSKFDLWPVFVFFDNTADCGCDGGWTEEPVGLSSHCLQNVPSSLHPLNSQSSTTSDFTVMKHLQWWHIPFSAHENEILADAWKFTAQVERFTVACSQLPLNVIQYWFKK